MNIAAKETNSRFYVSFYQIYNEKIYDLYNYTNIGLDIRESKNGEISIPDLVTVEISKMQEAIQFLMIGLKVFNQIFRIEPQGLLRPMQRVPVRILSFKLVWKSRRETKSSILQYFSSYSAENRRFGRF
jgi:hypothetical protein